MRIFAAPFRMGHHAQHIATFIEDARDVPGRTIHLFRITKGDAAFAFQAIERGGVRKIIAIMMGDWNDNVFACIIEVGKGRLRVRDGQLYIAADERNARIAHQRAGQEPAFGQHLKAIAYTKHIAAMFCSIGDGTHHWRLCGHRP